MGTVLGIGGVFYKAQEPLAVRDWYARVLGFELNPWGGASLPGSPAGQQWSVFPADTDYMAPSGLPFMLNLVVEDLDGLLARATAAGAQVLGRQDEDYGRFAWLMDPAGVKVELWEPVED
jgi:predicted enzyme related to lactoylglutathione lyase